MGKTSEVLDKVVEAYFEQPGKKLKEIFEEYAEDLTEDEAEKFYANLEIIVEDHQNVRG